MREGLEPGISSGYEETWWQRREKECHSDKKKTHPRPFYFLISSDVDRCSVIVNHFKGKVQRKRKEKKLTNVSFALTPTYVQ